MYIIPSKQCGGLFYLQASYYHSWDQYRDKLYNLQLYACVHCPMTAVSVFYFMYVHTQHQSRYSKSHNALVYYILVHFLTH